MCKFYSKLGETKFTALRQSNIYGPYDKFDLETGHVLCASVVKVMEAENQIIVWRCVSKSHATFLLVRQKENT